MWALLSSPTDTWRVRSCLHHWTAHILPAMLSSVRQGLPRQAGVTAGLAHNNCTRLSLTQTGRQAIQNMRLQLLVTSP